MLKVSWIINGEVTHNKTGVVYKLGGLSFNEKQKLPEGNGMCLKIVHEKDTLDKAYVGAVEFEKLTDDMCRVQIQVKATLEDYTIINAGRIY